MKEVICLNRSGKTVISHATHPQLKIRRFPRPGVLNRGGDRDGREEAAEK